ncbi:MAG: PKD domain-containing protein, partial [Actinomycetota bacterium]
VPVDLPVFISTDEAAEMGADILEQESVLKITEQGLLLFTTDAEDFHDWVPVLNPYPDFVGPHAGPDGPEDLGWSPDALAWIHTPIDHFEELVRYTSADQTGLGYSKGLAMSWEFCSMLSAWTMIQPSQGGLASANDDVVAFFETPTPNQNGGTQTFNASGSYRYTNVATRIMKTKGLIYRWDFGDGSVVSTKKPVLEHRFPTTVKAYQVTLTVIDPKTGQSDQMSLRIGTGRLAKR